MLTGTKVYESERMDYEDTVIGYEIPLGPDSTRMEIKAYAI